MFQGNHYNKSDKAPRSNAANNATPNDDSNKSRPMIASATERASVKKLRLDLEQVQGVSI